MRELTLNEVKHINGGVHVAVPWLAGVATTFAINYIWESIGGSEGVNKAIEEFKDYLSDVLYPRSKPDSEM